jgi:carbamoyltransferase
LIVLGISGGLGHDSSACLVRDGEIVAMVEEERLRRSRHAFGSAPVHAAAYCLDAAGICASDVDCVAAGWRPLDEPSGWPLGLHERLLGSDVFAGHRRPPVEMVGHHVAHAASAYFTSGLDEAAIVVIDGQGDGISTTLAHGAGDRIDVLSTNGIADSIGFFYYALNQWLGFDFGEEGKVMGLAAHGRPLPGPSPFRLTADGYASPLRLAPDLSTYDRHLRGIDAWLAWFEDRFGPRNRPAAAYRRDDARLAAEVVLAEGHADMAATGQRWLEDVVLHLVEIATRATGCRNVVLSGGVALNCTANGRLRRSGLVDDLHIFPASGDAGTSAGAALLVGGRARSRERIRHVSLGPEFSDEQVERYLARVGARFARCDDVPGRAAELIREGRVVGWMQGRLEVGPRALGNRSILAAPAPRAMHERVNTIKGREQWRPLGPSLPIERAGEYLDDAGPAPFMLTSCGVLPERVAEVPAVVHADGSCRPQLVERDVDPRYHALLTALGEATGTPVAINTSFNLRGQPIVCGPADAMVAFATSGLDAVFLESFLVEKRDRR